MGYQVFKALFISVLIDLTNGGILTVCGNCLFYESVFVSHVYETNVICNLTGTSRIQAC